MQTAIAFSADFAIIFVAATLIGYVAHKLGQPTIVAYILTGVILGPVVLDIVVEEGLVEMMSHLGIGFLLFLLGIKMHFDEVKKIFRPIVKIAGSQIVLQQSLAFLVAYMLGFPFWQALVIGLCTIFGATPVIVKALTDKGEIRTLPGRINVGVLIGQDIYLVLALALLGIGTLTSPVEIAFTVGKILLLVGIITVVTLAASRYVLPEVFKRVASHKEVLFVFTIAWAFLFIYTSEIFDLSLEVGAFLAGLALAQLPYSGELEEKIEPLTDFFILIFFSTIGLRLVADELFYYWQEAVIASLILIVGNFLIMFYLIHKEKFSVKTSFLGSINMIQVSEFSLVVGALAVAQGFIEIEVLGYLSLMALMTMSSSTYVLYNNQKIYEWAKPWLKRFESEDRRDEDVTEYQNHAVVLGYNHLSKKLIPVIKEHFDDLVVLDHDPKNIDKLKQSEFDLVYGDFRYDQVRKGLNLKNAAFVFSFLPDISSNTILMEEVSEDTTVFVECESEEDMVELSKLGGNEPLFTKVISSLQLFDCVEGFLKDEDNLKEMAGEDCRMLRGETSHGR